MNRSFEKNEWCEWPNPKSYQDLIEKASRQIKILKSKTPFATRFRVRSARHITRLERLCEACERKGLDYWIDNEIDMNAVYRHFNNEFEAIYDAIKEESAMSYLLTPDELTECKTLGANLLADEKYLSGPDLEILELVVSNEIFSVRDFHRIALNHGVWVEFGIKKS